MQTSLLPPDAINQITTLGSILAGFSLAAGIQLATSSSRNLGDEWIAILYFGCGIACVASVWMGILFYQSAGEPSEQRWESFLMYGLILLGIILFVAGTFVATDRSIRSTGVKRFFRFDVIPLVALSLFAALIAAAPEVSLYEAQATAVAATATAAAESATPRQQ